MKISRIEHAKLTIESWTDFLNHLAIVASHDSPNLANGGTVRNGAWCSPTNIQGESTETTGDSR